MALEFFRNSSRIPIFEGGKVFFLLLSFLPFQIAEFSKWIKCTQKYAIEGKKSTKSVERACDKTEYYRRYADDKFGFEGFLPKCNHTELHFEGVLPYRNGIPYC